MMAARAGIFRVDSAAPLGNHLLADKTLHFDVEGVGVREATAEELIHGAGGHHH